MRSGTSCRPPRPHESRYPDGIDAGGPEHRLAIGRVRTAGHRQEGRAAGLGGLRRERPRARHDARRSSRRGFADQLSRSNYPKRRATVTAWPTRRGRQVVSHGRACPKRSGPVVAAAVAATSRIALGSDPWVAEGSGALPSMTGGPRLLLAQAETAQLDRMRDSLAIVRQIREPDGDIHQLGTRVAVSRRQGRVSAEMRPDELRDQTSPLLVLMTEAKPSMATIVRAKRPRDCHEAEEDAPTVGVPDDSGRRSPAWNCAAVRHPLRSLGPVADRPPLALVPQGASRSAQGSTHRARTAAKQETTGALRRRRGRASRLRPVAPEGRVRGARGDVGALRESVASGAAFGDAEQLKYETMLEPVLDAMVARLEEVA